MNTPNPDVTAANALAIRSIVEEVVRRIRAEAAAGPAAATPTPRPSPPPAVTPAIPDKIVTLNLVERLPAGTSRLTVSAKAVITPSARDRARERGITIERTSNAASAAPARPFIVAHAEAGPDAAARTAEIVRAVPRAAHLPATGLADVITAIATHASRDGARAILLTSRCAVAVVVGNRSASLRAVTGRDAAGILASAAECGANLVVVNPKDLSALNLGRLAAEFAGRDFPVPATLATAPAGCGCTTHAH